MVTPKRKHLDTTIRLVECPKLDSTHTACRWARQVTMKHALIDPDIKGWAFCQLLSRMCWKSAVLSILILKHSAHCSHNISKTFQHRLYQSQSVCGINYISMGKIPRLLIKPEADTCRRRVEYIKRCIIVTLSAPVIQESVMTRSIEGRISILIFIGLLALYRWWPFGSRGFARCHTSRNVRGANQDGTGQIPAPCIFISRMLPKPDSDMENKFLH